MIKTNLPTGSPCTIRMQGTRDTVQVYDPYKKTFIDWQQSGVIALPSTITITTTTLEGQAVICQIGEYSKTTTFINGVAFFDMIFETGTATITCGEWSTTVEVTEQGGAFSGELDEIVEIVIWENSVVKNGATGNERNISYVSTEGAFKRKSLNFVNDGTMTIILQLTVKNGSDGKTASLLNNRIVMGTASYTFQAGQSYKYSIDEICKATSDTPTSDDKVDQIILKPYNVDGVNIEILHILSKIWLE